LAAVLLVMLFLPIFNRLSGKQLGLDPLGGSFTLLGILGITVLTGLLAGSYPAFFLSSFQPDKILKTTSITRKSGSGASFMRKSLVVVQFIISIFLIICTTLLYRQMEFVRNNRLGFDQDHVVYLPLKSQGNLWERYDAARIWSTYTAFKQELAQDPNITSVAAATGLPFGPMGSEFGQLDWPGKDPETNIEMNHMAVDPGFAEALGLETTEGRFFSDQVRSDTNGFVLNEKAVKAIGLEEPLGKPFRLLDKSGTIIGVVKDFHFASLHTEIKPLVLHAMPYQYWMYRNYVLLRLKPENLEKTMASLEDTWNRVIPEYPFEFHFLDLAVADAYRAEQRLETILRIFTFLAIFISCFGLFGLISFTAEQRTKEIGIRKVMGASVAGIVRLLSKDFVVLVALANLIAWPAAYIVMSSWLENFAYRIDIGLMSFILSGFLALFIALCTISYQSIRAATADPVDSLRYE
jgi:putative ABC transport system permease protein